MDWGFGGSGTFPLNSTDKDSYPQNNHAHRHFVLKFIGPGKQVGLTEARPEHGSSQLWVSIFRGLQAAGFKGWFVAKLLGRATSIPCDSFNQLLVFVRGSAWGWIPLALNTRMTQRHKPRKTRRVQQHGSLTPFARLYVSMQSVHQ